MNTPDIRMQAAKFIFDCEARYDREKHLRVYQLDAADGGGSFEVAGINDGYHPEQARMLRVLIKAGSHREAELYAIEFIASYTDVVTHWTGGAGSISSAPLEVFLRDCCFNRGPKGALRILQGALGVETDGKFGPITKNEIEVASFGPGPLLAKLRVSRERYEGLVAPPVGERRKYWDGLVNRWNKAYAFAQTFLNPPPQPFVGGLDP